MSSTQHRFQPSHDDDGVDLVVRLDEHRRVTYWGAAAAEALGLPIRDVLGRPIDSLLFERGHAGEGIEGALTNATDDDGLGTVELVCSRTDGEEVELQGVVSSAPDANGPDSGCLLVLHPTPAQHRVDSRLIHYLHAITSDSADAIILLDGDERICSWNRGAQDIYGFTAEQMLGQPVEVLVPDERKLEGELDRLRELVNEHGYVRNYETSRVSRDGITVPVELTRSAICDENGRLIGSSVIVRDITVRKKLEERLLHTERLAVVGRMAAQVAHELRNPLSSISLNAEMLADELSSMPDDRADEARSLLASITSEIERLASVSEEYLQFARLPELSPEATDVNLVVEDLAEFTELELTQAGVTVGVEVGEVPEIAVDRRQLRQALVNLIRNALEAMQDGGKLSLCAAMVDDGDTVEISVIDTGPGVPSDSAKQIFEPFFSTKENGTGLGLSLARRVAHEHGGELVHRPTPDGGATFTMRLPKRGSEAI